MGRRKYTDEQIDRAVALREEGKSLAQIARVTGMGKAAVDWYCLKYGVGTPGRAPAQNKINATPSYIRNGFQVRGYSAEEDTRLVEWSISGRNPTEIARMIGRTANSVRNRLMTLARHDALREAADDR